MYMHIQVPPAPCCRPTARRAMFDVPLAPCTLSAVAGENAIFFSILPFDDSAASA